MIGPGSRFIGRSLKEIEFRRRYGMTALALSRHGRDVVEKVGKIPLMVGDVLLVQGPETRLDDLRSSASILVLSDLSHFLLDPKKGTYVVAFFVPALVLGTLDILPLAAAVLGLLLTIIVRAIPPEDVYR
jgi:di/tricarboxylate transporter